MSTDDRLFPDCGRVRGELAAFLYDEVAPDARETLERHLEGCAPCRDELATLRDTRRLLARWETPVASDDTRLLARAIAAEARGVAPSGETMRPTSAPSPRRGRLIRWSALVSGAAAAALFTLSVLGARVRFGDGRMQLDFALPGSRPAEPAVADQSWHDEVRAIAAQEVAARSAHLEQTQEELLERMSRMTRQEMEQEILRLTKAVDYALEENSRVFDARLTSLGRDAALADQEMRGALTSLASYIPEPNR